MERFAAFRHGNFRRYFVGQVISSVGSWLQALAVTWLVLDLTGRSDRLGVAVALQFLPLLLLGAPAGVLADRVDNRRLLLATSAVSAVLALVFGLVVSAGTPNLWVIYGLTFLSGLVLAVERPAMQALLFQLVGRDDAAERRGRQQHHRVGVTARRPGARRCDGGGHRRRLLLLRQRRVVRRGASSPSASISRSRLVPRPIGARAGGNLRAAVAYVRHRPDVRRPLVVMAVVGLVALNFQTTFPSMVRFGFDRGAGAVGTAMSVSAIGSILGGIYAAGITPEPATDARRGPRRLRRHARSCSPSRRTTRRSSLLGIPLGLRLGVLPVGRHRRRAAGDRAVDAGSGDGAAPDGVVRQHADRRAGDGLGHPGHLAPGAVRARRPRRPRPAQSHWYERPLARSQLTGDTRGDHRSAIEPGWRLLKCPAAELDHPYSMAAGSEPRSCDRHPRPFTSQC